MPCSGNMASTFVELVKHADFDAPATPTFANEAGTDGNGDLADGERPAVTETMTPQGPSVAVSSQSHSAPWVRTTPFSYRIEIVLPTICYRGIYEHYLSKPKGTIYYEFRTDRPVWLLDERGELAQAAANRELGKQRDDAVDPSEKIAAALPIELVDKEILSKRAKKWRSCTRLFPLLKIRQNSSRIECSKEFGTDWSDRKVPPKIAEQAKTRKVEEQQNRYHGAAQYHR